MSEWDKVSTVVTNDEWDKVSAPVSADEWNKVSAVDTPAPAPAQTQSSLPTGGRDFQTREMGLPTPTPDMFRGMNAGDAKALRDAYANHPYSESDWMGNVKYKGQELPSLNSSAMNALVDMTPTGLMRRGAEALTGYDLSRNDPSRGVAGGLTNLPKEIGTTVLAGLDTLIELPRNRETGEPLISSNMAAAADEALPEYYPENGMQEFMGTGAQAAVGGGIGTAATKNLVAVAPKVFKAFTGLVGAEAGAAMSVDQDSEGLLPEALLPMSIDPDGKYNEELLKKRFNILTESVLLAKGLEKTAKSAAWASKYAYNLAIDPLVAWGSRSRQEQAIGRELVDVLQGFDSKMTNEEQYAFRMDLADRIDKFSKVQTEGLENVTLPDGSKMQNLDYKRDTLGAYTEGLPNTREGEEKAALANMLRAGQLGKQSNALEVSRGQPAKQARSLYEQMETGFGGEQGIDAARQGIQREGRARVQTAADQVPVAQQRVADAEEGAKSLIRDDPNFGPTLDPLDNQVKLDVGENVRKIRDDITDELTKVSKEMSEKKNAMAADLPDADPDIESFVEATKNFDLEKNVPQDIREALGTAMENSSWKELNDIASFKLGPAIANARRANKFDEADAMAAIYNNITKTQVDAIADGGEPGLKDAYGEFRRFYKEEYAPIWRQGKTQDLQQISRDMAGKPDDLYTESGRVISSAFDNPDNIRYSERIVEALGDRSDLAESYVKGRMAEKVQGILNSKRDLTPEDIAGLQKDAQKFGPMLKGKFDDFFTRLGDNNLSVKERTKELEEAITNSKKVADDVYDGELKDFFSRHGETVTDKENGFAVFKKLMRDDEGAAKIRNLVKISKESNDPAINDGMKAAYAKWSVDELFEAGTTTSGAPKFNAPQAEKRYEDMRNIAKELFGEEADDLLRAQDLLVNEAKKTAATDTQRAYRLGDTDASDNAARQGAGLLITSIFGQLSRAGAQTRAVTGRAISKMSNKDIAREMMTKIYANPQEFTRIIRDVAKRDVKKVSQSTKNRAWDFFTKGGVFGNPIYNDSYEEKKNQSDLDRTRLRAQTNKLTSRQ